MPNKKYLPFTLGVILFGVLIFLFNARHLLQQGIYQNLFFPLATNLLEGKGYSLHSVPAFYPMWGYVALVWCGLSLGNPELFLFIIQFLFSLVGIYYFYRLFSLEPSLWHIPFFLPYFAATSVRWATALSFSLSVPFVYFLLEYLVNKSKKDIVVAGLLLGLILNFRSEFLYLPGSFLLLFLFKEMKSLRQSILFSMIAVGSLSVLMVLPWGIRSANLNGGFRLTSTNGGSVSYISLGQLPQNPWGIVPKDTSGFIFVQSRGISDPFSPQGDSLLKATFFENIRSHPVAFARKMIKNSTDALLGGIYTGEYSTRFIPAERVVEMNKELYGASITKKISLIFSFQGKEFIGMFIEYFIFAVFKFVWYILIGVFLLYFIRLRSLNWQPIGLVTIFFLYLVAIVAFFQYETRHMNMAYIFLLGLFFVTIEEIRKQHISLLTLRPR